MAPHTFHLLSVDSSVEASVITALWSHNPKPVTIGKAHFFISSSHLSSVLSNSPITNTSPFNFVTILPGTSTSPFACLYHSPTLKKRSFTADIDDKWTPNYATRNSSLLHANEEPIVSFSLEPDTPPSEDEEGVEFPLTPVLRSFLSRFSHEHTGPATNVQFPEFL